MSRCHNRHNQRGESITMYTKRDPFVLGLSRSINKLLKAFPCSMEPFSKRLYIVLLNLCKYCTWYGIYTTEDSFFCLSALFSNAYNYYTIKTAKRSQLHADR